MRLYAEFGSPLPLVCAITIGGVGAGLILGSASINQLSLNRGPFNHLLWNAASFPLSASI